MREAYLSIWGRMRTGLYGLFESRFSERLDEVFVETFAGRVHTYRDAVDSSGRFAAVLRDLNVGKGDRVAVQVRKSPENIFLYLAVLRCGAVYVPLNTAYRSAENSYFLKDVGPQVWVVSPDQESEARIQAADAGTPHLLTLGVNADGSLCELAARRSGTFETAGISADDLAAIVYTSGTTGRPKGAMITHGNLAANAADLCCVWEFRAADVLLHALPLFHIHGLFVALHCALLSAARILLLPEFDVAKVIEALPRVTVMMGVPTFYTRLLASSAFKRSLATSVRLFTSGSAPLLAQTHLEFMDRTGHRIVERYGLTETGILTSNTLNGERAPGTVGVPLPGVDLRIADADGVAVGPNVIGVVEARGPGISGGYWKAPEKTAETRRAGGFFITGDLATQDEQGCVRIVGRGKDLIISGGFNVYPKEVETALDAIEGILESAVVGPAHPDFGEAVVAVIVMKEGSVVLTEELIITRMKGEIANFKVPKRVFFVPELPRNAMGKVQKNILLERYRETFTAASRACT